MTSPDPYMPEALRELTEADFSALQDHVQRERDRRMRLTVAPSQIQATIQQFIQDGGDVSTLPLHSPAVEEPPTAE